MMVAMALLFAGWSLLAGSQPKQFGRIVRHGHLSKATGIAMRWAGAVLLLVPLAILVQSEGLSFGALVWACLLSISAMVVALVLAWLPRITSAT
ncbi:DUF3325 family protein [Bradyrhizobium liaoningense]|uniref:DUF3325 family protein n=1 Tax=Bradyrhizobium liaoningense TaxID=43992 RepID=UPI001BA892BC|nr:DUF3325 family protein [Bradyrhizobium liaoningense]MBR0858467.1 DUF3325 family protein [Bradyrhizobium liaoningense]